MGEEVPYFARMSILAPPTTVAHVWSMQLACNLHAARAREKHS